MSLDFVAKKTVGTQIPVEAIKVIECLGCGNLHRLWPGRVSARNGKKLPEPEVSNELFFYDCGDITRVFINPP